MCIGNILLPSYYVSSSHFISVLKLHHGHIRVTIHTVTHDGYILDPVRRLLTACTQTDPIYGYRLEDSRKEKLSFQLPSAIIHSLLSNVARENSSVLNLYGMGEAY